MALSNDDLQAIATLIQGAINPLSRDYEKTNYRYSIYLKQRHKL